MKVKHCLSFFSLALLFSVQSARSVDVVVPMPTLQNPKSAEDIAAYVAAMKEWVAAKQIRSEHAVDADNSYVDLNGDRSKLAEVATKISAWDQDKDSPICQLSKYIADGYNVALKDAVLESLAYAQRMINDEQAEEINPSLNKVIEQIVADQLAVDRNQTRVLPTAPLRNPEEEAIRSKVIKLREKIYLLESAKFFKDVEFKDHVTFEKNAKFQGNIVTEGTLSAADAVIGCDLSVGCNIAMHNSSDATVGNIIKDGAPFIHNFGTENTFVGINAGNFTMTGNANTGYGTSTLALNTSGTLNTASGLIALTSNQSGAVNTAHGAASLVLNTSGSANTAVGYASMALNTTGNGNTAVGIAALVNNTIGGGNTAIGAGALDSNISGNDNVGIGPNAGTSLLNGDNNIYIAADGTFSETGMIRVGTLGTHTACFIQGIDGAAVGILNSPVLVNSAGQLGTTISSRRFKHDIADMSNDSANIFNLRPVTFAYNNDATERTQYGLIAEEVDQVFPALVVKDADGNPYMVQYHVLLVLLLNELIKQKAEFSNAIEQQNTIIALQTNMIECINNRLLELEEQN